MPSLLHFRGSPPRAAVALLVMSCVVVAFARAQTESVDRSPSSYPYFPIPYPDMEGLEDAVREQLNEAHGDLEAWMGQEAPPGAELATAFGRLGKLLHAYQLFDAAAACYRNAAALAPEDFRWPYYLGHVHQRSGRFDTAAEAYRAALKLKPLDVAARVHLGEALLALDRPEEAVVELRQVLESAPGNPAVHALLGEIALARGELRQAVELLSSALVAVPAADRLHYPLGMAYRGLGDLEKAREHLGQIGTVGLKVEDPLLDELRQLAEGERVHLLRGRQAFAAGRFGDAASEFRKALQADPRSARVRVNLGSALGQLGDLVGAVEQYEAALSLDPANVVAHFNLGVLSARQGDDEKAVRHLRAAVDLDYEDAEAQRRLGLALRRLGRHQEALPHLQEGAMMAPADADAWLDYAVLLADLGSYRKAREILEEAHGRIPQSGGLAHALARLLAGSPDRTARDGERALDLARRVHEARPTPGHAATVAMALAELGRCDEASKWQERAVRGADDDGQPQQAAELRRDLARYAAGAPCN